MVPRYAVYFAPEFGSPLDQLGAAWFGRDPNGKPAPQPAVPGISPPRLQQLTESPRRYGFHGTLKPPFELNPTSSLSALLAAARVFAKSLAPVEIPPLELAVIGKFVALTPEVSSAPLEHLAAACVRGFEGFRLPLSEEQRETYQRKQLTVHQEQMLEHWGYPYVMEEYRFHMSLTDRIDDDKERDAIMEVLSKLSEPILSKSISVRSIAVFGQDGRDLPMTIIERIPFGRIKT